jgi:AcrR family transcriptional regulator
MTVTGPRPDQRTERSKQAVLDATRELLAEASVRDFTVVAVAARAGVAKTTIYRRWRNRWELALDAVMIDMLDRFDDPARPAAARSGSSHRSRSTPIVSNNARVSSLPNMSRCAGRPPPSCEGRSHRVRSSSGERPHGMRVAHGLL